MPDTAVPDLPPDRSPHLAPGVPWRAKRRRARSFLRWATHNGRNLSLAALVLAVLTVIGLKAPHAAGSFSFAFRLVGFGSTPLHSLLFAFTASEALSSVLPIPSGIGVVEGGLVGALALIGTPFGHAIVAVVVFRVVSYWIVTGVATLSLIVISHRSRDRVADEAAEEASGRPPLLADSRLSTRRLTTRS